MKGERLLGFTSMLLALLVLQGCFPGSHPLVEGALKGDLGKVKKEIEKGVAPDVESAALHVAAHNGHVDVIKHLLAKGADPRRPDSGENAWPMRYYAGPYADSTGNVLNYIPWGTAFFKGDIPLCKLYIENGIRIDETDEWGRSPIHFAIDSYPNNPCISYLRGLGADINKVSKSGMTPLALLIHKELTDPKLKKGGMKLSNDFYRSGGRPNPGMATVIADTGLSFKLLDVRKEQYPYDFCESPMAATGKFKRISGPFKYHNYFTVPEGKHTLGICYDNGSQTSYAGLSITYTQFPFLFSVTLEKGKIYFIKPVYESGEFFSTSDGTVHAELFVYDNFELVPVRIPNK